MPIVSGGGGGGGGPAAGTYVPVADSAGVTVDSTTYADPIAGGGAFLTTLVYSGIKGLLAVAKSGDAFPRWLMSSDARDGFYLGSGAFDPYVSGPIIYTDNNGNLNLQARSAQLIKIQSRMEIDREPGGAGDVPYYSLLSPRFSITSGALPTVTISSGTGRQVSTVADVETVTPFTGDGTNNAATCLVQLSPDNVTYSTIVTESIAAALNLTGVLTITVNLRVPLGWYVKLTATHGTLGTTTYY